MQKIEALFILKEKFDKLGEVYKKMNKRLDELEKLDNYSELEEYKELRAEQIEVYEKRRRLANKFQEIKNK